MLQLSPPDQPRRIKDNPRRSTISLFPRLSVRMRTQQRMRGWGWRTDLVDGGWPSQRAEAKGNAPGFPRLFSLAFRFTGLAGLADRQVGSCEAGPASRLRPQPHGRPAGPHGAKERPAPACQEGLHGRQEESRYHLT